MRSLLLCSTLALPLAGCATSAANNPATKAAEDPATKPARDLFAKYDALTQTFDPAIAELYSDDAVMKDSHTKPTGEVAKREMSAAQFKPLFPKMLAVAKLHGDKSDYSKVAYEKRPDGFRVTAHRHARLRCYVDETFTLILRPDAQGALRIVEEQTSSRTLSECPDQPLAPLMAKVADELSPKLPIQADESTRLETVSAEEDTLRFGYVLTLPAGETIDGARLAEALAPQLAGQACVLNPKLRAVLDSAGKITFSYAMGAGDPLAEVTITERDCP